MISRLLLTTAIGFALGSAAFAQGTTGPSATDQNVPAAADSASTANATVKLSEGVSVTPQDRARIGDSVARMNVKSLRGVDFAVSVGGKVPRELRVHRLPTEVGQIVPAYRDYRFLVVEKDIVIVEPKASKIVAVLKPESAAAVANAAPAAPTPIKNAPAPAPEAPAAAAAPIAATPAAPAIQTPATPAPAAAVTAPAVPASTTATPPATPAAPAAVASTPATAESSSVPGQASAAETEKPKAKKQASRSQRRNETRHSSAEVRVGQRVADDVVLYRVPPRYYYDVPASRDYYRSRAYVGGSYVGTWRGRPVYQEY